MVLVVLPAVVRCVSPTSPGCYYEVPWVVERVLGVHTRRIRRILRRHSHHQSHRRRNTVIYGAA